MSKASSSSPPVVVPAVGHHRAINAAAKADPDAPLLTLKQLKSMVPVVALRGRPKSTNPKQLASVRYIAEVLEYFRFTCDGLQSRMDGVLRHYVTRQSRRA